MLDPAVLCTSRFPSWKAITHFKQRRHSPTNGYCITGARRACSPTHWSRTFSIARATFLWIARARTARDFSKGLSMLSAKALRSPCFRRGPATPSHGLCKSRTALLGLHWNTPNGRERTPIRSLSARFQSSQRPLYTRKSRNIAAM